MVQSDALQRRAGSMSVVTQVKEPAAKGVRQFRCEIIRTVHGLHAIAAQWRRLQHDSGQDTQAFQSMEWALAYSNAFMSTETATPERYPLLVLLRDAAGVPVLLLPLMRERYPLGLRVITWLSDPLGQYGDVISSLRGEALHEGLTIAMQTVRGEGADLVRLRNVRGDALIRPWLEQHFGKTPELTGAPWLDLKPFATPEDFEKHFSAKQRRRRRKILNALKRHLGAEPEFVRIEGVQAQQQAIVELLRAKRSWLKEKGLISRALFCERTEVFLRSLAETSAMGAASGALASCELVITALQANGRQLSWELGLRYRGRHYAYITAHRPELTRFSIGRLHMFLAQRCAVEDGLHAFDMLVPAAPHKKSWSSGVMPTHNYFEALTARGRLLGQGYLNVVRPLLQRAYHVIPPYIRRMLRLSELSDHDSGVS